LSRFASGELRLGAAELGTKNDDISQQWIRQQNIWIAELNGLFADLDGMRLGTRAPI
jgi:hypothetical protein